jgi:hypothetical protein
MQRKITSKEPQKTDTHFVDTVERALNEELGLSKEEIDESDIYITALARAAIQEDMNIHILALVKFPQLTYKGLETNIAKVKGKMNIAKAISYNKVDIKRMAAPSSGEHLDIDAIPFTIDGIVQTLLHGDKYVPNKEGSESNYFQPSSRMRILFSAFQHYGSERVMEALRKAKKNYPQ